MISLAAAENFLNSNEEKTVWILGKKYNSVKDRDKISKDIRSRLWFTYRRGFSPIGDSSGPTSDSGWGCMHRCGQMMIGQTLTLLHLSRDWRWNPDNLDEIYQRILRMFEDQPSAIYSIHSIASFNDADRKIGDWLGPNTAAQILKKLAINDRWTNLYTHVTAEDGVVIEEIKNLCYHNEQSQNHNTSAEINDSSWVKRPGNKHERKHSERALIVSNPISKDRDGEFVEIIMPPVCNMPSSPSDNEDTHPRSPDSVDLEACPHTTPHLPWRPLLLIIPLRLGLHELNMMYAPHLMNLFKLRQCVGVLGGRPMHALWLIGSIGDKEVIFLDPHVTQPAAIFSQSSPEASSSLDASFHCSSYQQLPLNLLDPSLAVGFVCATESEFDALCEDLKEYGIAPALFEVHDTRPSYLPPPCLSAVDTPEGWGEVYTSVSASLLQHDSSHMSSSSVKAGSDGDFEML
nr:cysteine protease atg4b [Hymenolepis microstoma]